MGYGQLFLRCPLDAGLNPNTVVHVLGCVCIYIYIYIHTHIYIYRVRIEPKISGAQQGPHFSESRGPTQKVGAKPKMCHEVNLCNDYQNLLFRQGRGS